MFYSAYKGEKTTNGLFADDTYLDGTTLRAKIACGRHLQNLDESSGVAGKPPDFETIAAEQIKDIDFANGSVWHDCYSGGEYFILGHV